MKSITEQMPNRPFSLFPFPFSLIALLLLGMAAPLLAQVPWNFAQKDSAWEAYFDRLYFSQGKKPPRSVGYKAYQRWHWYWERKLGHRGTVDEETRKAYYHDITARALTSPLSRPAETNDVGVFREVGQCHVDLNDHNASLSGRVNDIAVNPFNSNEIWIAAASGGVWRTIDAGLSWSQVNDGFATLGFGSIAFHPTDLNTIFLGTGDCDAFDAPSIGLLKSTDHGRTWALTGLSWDFFANLAIDKVVIETLSPSTMLVSGSSGVWRSTDGGDTWHRTLEANCRGFIEDPTDPARYFVGVEWDGTHSGVYRSTDHGETWTQLTGVIPVDDGNFGYASLAVSPVDGFVYACVADTRNGALYNFYYSRNHGDTWNLRTGTPNLLGWDAAGTSGQGWYDNVMTADPTQAGVLWAGGVHIWKTTDRGVNWVRQDSVDYIHVDHHSQCFDPNNPQVFYSGNDGGIYRTQDGGNSWEPLNAGIATIQYYAIAVAPMDPNVVFGGCQDNGTHRWIGAEPWEQVYGGDGMQPLVDWSDPFIVYAEWQNGHHVKSYDQGNSFRDCQTGIGEDGPWVTPVVMDPVNHRLLYTTTTQVYRTLNGGSNWVRRGTVPVPTKFLDKLAIAPSDPNIIFTSGYDTTWTEVLFKSTNAGETWEDYSGSYFPWGGISDIAIDPFDPNTVYLSFGGWGLPSDRAKVMKSTDGGYLFMPRDRGLPRYSVTSLLIDPASNSDVYAATEMGIYRSTNGGRNWDPWGTGLPNVDCVDLQLHEATGKLFVGTYGRGVWWAYLPTSPEGVRNAPIHGARNPQLVATARSGTATVGLRWENFGADQVTFTLYDVLGHPLATAVGRDSDGELDLGPISGGLAPGLYMAEGVSSVCRKSVRFMARP